MTAQQAKTIKYKSKVDWWIWAVIIFTAVIIFVVGIGLSWWITALLGIVTLGTMCLAFLGVWYVIDNDTLIVYQFFMPHRYPIDRIKSVKVGFGILSAPALSTQRIAIHFIDRRILKSSLPLEISPSDRQGFIDHLTSINPSITVLN